MSTRRATLQIIANLTELLKVRQFVEETAVTCINNQQTISDIVLAIDEAVTNIIRHGYQRRSGHIGISINCEQNKFAIKIYDNSPNFDPTQVIPPDPNIPLSQRKPGGMGIHMIRQLTDDWHYQKLADGRNELTLIKYFEDNLGQHPCNSS